MTTFGGPYGGAQGAGDVPPRPPVIRQNIRASKGFFEKNNTDSINAFAQMIVQRRWGSIAQLILGQRQMGMVLPATYKRVAFDDLTIEYQRLGAQETVILTAYPETTTKDFDKFLLDAELNFDGYCMWVHGGADPFSGITDTGPAFEGPFDIFFNEYLIETQFKPARPYGGYMILFGRTALLCVSNQDPNHKNSLYEKAQPSQLPNLVTPPVGWGSYDAGVSPTGALQSSIDKTLGYWLFDWLNPHNPAIYLTDLPLSNPNRTWQSMGGTTPNITKGMWFEDATNSPLDYKGPNNNFYVGISPGGKDAGETVVMGTFFAEFYDRQKGRSVQQSWTQAYREGRQIIISDSPLMWASGYLNFAFFSGSGIGFDLTPGLTEKENAALGPHDGVDAGAGGSNSGSFVSPNLSPEDQAKFAAWQAQCVAIQKKYSDDYTAALDAWTTEWSATGPHAKELNQAHNVISFWQNNVDSNGHQLPHGDDLLADPQDDGSVVYGPPQQYYFSWNAPYTGVNPLPRIANRYIFSAPFGHPLLIDTQGDPGSVLNHLDDYGGSIFGNSALTQQQAFILADAYEKNPDNPLQQRQKARDQVDKDVPPPKFPDAPVLGTGADFRKYSYRQITGDNGVFTYPSKFSGDK